MPFDVLPNEYTDVREVGVSAITRNNESSFKQWDRIRGQMNGGGNLIYGFFGNFHIRARRNSNTSSTFGSYSHIA